MVRTLLKRARQHFRAIGKSNQKIFDEIYRSNHWGGHGLYSGNGSEVENSIRYEDLVVEYVVENKTTSLVDVGCGDFQVSQRILARLPDTVRYTGLDVSQVVIERNNDLFARDGIAFVRCDAALDELPSGDLVLIREVLQHLSNSDIIKILRKVRQFPHVIISNTRKKGAARRNIDIASGASARAVLGSGLWLDLPPFNCHVEELLLVDHTEASYEIETVRLINDEPGVSKSSQ